MPSYIGGDLYLGKVSGGSLILKGGRAVISHPPTGPQPPQQGGPTGSQPPQQGGPTGPQGPSVPEDEGSGQIVVVEPTKPPTSGGVSDVPYSGYAPKATDRVILFDGDKTVVTASGPDAKNMLSGGKWHLVAMFNNKTDIAEQVAAKIVKNPKPDNGTLMGAYNLRRLNAVATVGTVFPMATVSQLAIREKTLSNGMKRGELEPVPEKRQTDAMTNLLSNEAARATMASALMAQTISNVLAGNFDYLPTSMVVMLYIKVVNPNYTDILAEDQKNYPDVSFGNFDDRKFEINVNSQLKALGYRNEYLTFVRAGNLYLDVKPVSGIQKATVGLLVFHNLESNPYLNDYRGILEGIVARWNAASSDKVFFNEPTFGYANGSPPLSNPYIYGSQMPDFGYKANATR